MTASAAVPVIGLVQLAQWARGDLAVRELPGDARAREAFLAGGIDGVSIDSRTVEPGQLFVPLPGSQVDGHAFLDAAFARGAAAALCSRAHHATIAGREPGPLVVVDDVTEGLQRLARAHREGWSGTLIGVTGSVGKTTTKELVAAALASAVPTLRTEGNLNNHWGVPLTLLRLRAEHRAAVVEIGMNHRGEVAALAALALPGAAVVTSAGSAHLEHMGSLEAIAHEKASLALALDARGVAFVSADSPRLLEAVNGARARVVTYGFADGADVRPARAESLGEAGSAIEVAGFPRFTLALPGRHQVANALAALAVARELGLDPAAVARALADCRPTRGRMEVRRLRGATLLVDCYNANPESMRAALETLAGWPDAARRIAVLGDMLELGPEAARLHRETAATARGAELWVTGRHAADLTAGAATAGVPARAFEGIDGLREALRGALADGVVVLLKASRGAALERVLDGLEGKD
jgi:UDP-N-acetylmuramoyl-tripeptide--D-alanyl-D-alanine ligase